MSSRARRPSWCEPGLRSIALTELITATVKLGDLDSVRHLLTLALTQDPPLIGEALDVAARHFPAAARAAGNFLIELYQGS